MKPHLTRARLLAPPARPKLRCKPVQIRSKLAEHELRLLATCGKERTGFPQAGGADPSEIHYPVDPEIWKRCYNLR
jgi:hypothetical protein